MIRKVVDHITKKKTKKKTSNPKLLDQQTPKNCTWGVGFPKNINKSIIPNQTFFFSVSPKRVSNNLISV